MADPPDSQPIFFLKERLCSYSGYSALPTALGAMHFYLPKFTVMTRRAVQTGDKFWELWSPNSSRAEFYPGLADPSVDLELLPEHLRRSDGHLGRFDPTVSPQHYDPKRPWLGFIRRTSRGHNRPEFRPFLSVWKPAKYSNRGSIDADYVGELIKRSDEQEHNADNWRIRLSKHEKFWNIRPRAFLFVEMAKLSDPMDMDQAVDELAKIQRRIKHMAAWCGMASALVKDSKGIIAMTEVPTADDSLMGVWLNGCPEPEGLWLLRHGVPCFLIHEADSVQDLNRLESYRPNYRFAFPDGTAINDLRTETHPIEVIAYEKSRLNNSKEDYAILPARSVPDYSYLDNLRSSPVGQGFSISGYVNPRSQPMDKISSLASDPSTWPPPIAAVTQGLSWSTWEEELEESGRIRFVKRGKKQEPDGDLCWFYDRVLCRRLALLTEPWIPHSYQADPKTFGLPVPDWPFEELVGTEWKLREASKWMYSREQPAKGSVGLRPMSRAPSSSELRPIVSSKSSSSLSESTKSITLNERVPVRNNERSLRAQEPLYMNPRRVTAGAPYVGRGRELLPLPTPLPQPIHPAPLPRSLPPARSTDQVQMEPRSRFRSPPRRLSLPRGRSKSPYERPSPHPRDSSYHRGRSPYSSRQTSSSERSIHEPQDSYSRGRIIVRSRSRSPFNRRSAPYRSDTSDKYSRERNDDERGRYRLDSRPRSPSFRSTELSLNERTKEAAPTPPDRGLKGRFPLDDSMDVDKASPAPPATEDTLDPTQRELAPSSSLELALRISNPSNRDYSMSLDSPEPERMDTSWDGVSSIGINQTNPLKSLGTTSSAVRALVRPTIPILSNITPNSRSRFLCLWSLNKFYTWQEVTSWVVSVSKMSPIIDFERAVRWYDKVKKVQLFYLAFKSEEGATTFRGIVNGRNTVDQFNIQCDFVDTQAYSTVSGQSKDSWKVNEGFGPGVDPNVILPENNDGIRPSNQFKKTRRNDKKKATTHSKKPDSTPPSTAKLSDNESSQISQASSSSLLSRIGPPLEASHPPLYKASSSRTRRLL
ncbi:hypothetical protein CVT26_007525 [Gymnopilus dilepis]|uniref:Uncharacterized protein n=1 Tax=Gymnopilus dilepis TaxID=231916 RepID=A0A409WHZ7_9AGAR|nr:hypothetical protein CVT26_007525 [Gymnopilus dilepis]